ncbi:hypothetical protein GCM10010266_19810 [Streptomyces griseomycini]|nr:hypothetical protein GCM10010266_19810 [Streptomyces griseomycini]
MPVSPVRASVRVTASPGPADLEPPAYHRRTEARWPGMDSTETARRLLGHGAASRPYAELTSGYAGHTPIYAALVAEWRARGRTVPEHHDGQWASFAASTASGRAPVLSVPFPVPVPLLRPPDEEAPDEEAPDHDVSDGEARHDAPRAEDTHEDITSTPPPPAPR